uniref:Uncharacterized protein n=1 Tax=Telonemida sp. TaxID=2652706 RepID=A0A5P8DJV2_9EUKA|nr:hypothetical protein [Telonemida sp.]
MIDNIMNFVFNWYSKKVNDFFIRLGGANKTFLLKNRNVCFAILKPSKYNLTFIVFNTVKQFTLFKVFFKLLLQIPYFFTENFIGRSLFSIIAIWAAVGREPITVIFCFNFLVEFYVFLFFISYFLRLDTVYLYCIDTYGVFFVEKYLVNPLTSAQGKALIRGAVYVAGGFGLDQIDRNACSSRSLHEAREYLAMYKEQGISLKKEDLFKIQSDAKTNNIPRVDTFSTFIATMLSSLGKK